MRIQKQWMMSVAFMFVSLVCAGVGAFAQEPPQGTGIRVPAPPGEDTVFFISSEMSFDGKVVKGAPYSAQAITETTRTLGDGNKIKNARIVKALLNGQVIHENQELLTPTGDRWKDAEMFEGPLMLQGDHGPVAFRNMRVRVLESAKR